MIAIGIDWIAHRVDDQGLEHARRLAAALALEVITSTDHLLVIRGVHGEIVEHCGPDHPAPPHLFAAQDTVTGYAVTRLEEAAAALTAAGFVACGAITEAEDVRFQHFADPAGRVTGIIERR